MVVCKACFALNSSVSFLKPHHEAHAAHGVDQLRLLRAFHLLPQVADINIEQVVVAIETFAPNAMQDLQARLHFVGRSHQEHQQLVLLVRELDAAATSSHIVIGLVELQITNAQYIGLAGLRLQRLHPPLQSTEPG